MNFIATKSIIINASPERVWEGLTNPKIVKQYLFGTEITSDWKVDSPIKYKGVWEGKPYEDKGTIIEIEPPKVLKSTYYSHLSQKEDKPENYNTITYELFPGAEATTQLTVTQDNNATQVEADEAERNWVMVLDALKKWLESN